MPDGITEKAKEHSEVAYCASKCQEINEDGNRVTYHN